jgi:hypothetical protein
LLFLFLRIKMCLSLSFSDLLFLCCATHTVKKIFSTTIKTTKIEEDEVPALMDPFFIIETVCIVWFTFEFLVR